MWEELCNPHGEDIDSLTNCITYYITFCVENTVPTRTVRCFSKEKKRAGKREELKAGQQELRSKIREGKEIYRKKMEDQLQQNNTRGV